MLTIALSTMFAESFRLNLQPTMSAPRVERQMWIQHWLDASSAVRVRHALATTERGAQR
jgi:hypothetical protein